MTSTTIAELLTALLETALASAGIADTLLHRERGSKPSQSQTTLNTESAHVPSKDSRAGVAGLIEVITQDGRTILFQDVEVSVQSIRLLFQCVMAYPSHFLEPFLRLEQVESKLFRLLVHSPASRIRNETARQLEHLSLLSSRYLRFGETCIRGRDSSTGLEICLLHNRVYHARLLHFLLRILFHTGLPFYTAHLDLHSKSALTLLMHSSNYFHVRSFLLGQTPASLMNMWFHTDHVKVLWGELNKFQNIVGVESNFSRSKRNLTDCLLAGHLVAASVLCAQAVACVNSHAVCVVHGTAVASSLGFDVHSKSHTGAYPPVCGGMDVPAPIALLDALTTGPDETDHLRPPTSVPGESDNLLGLLPPPDSQSLDETFFINNQIALNACSNCLRVSRNFVHYLIVGCLFPDAAHILHEQSVQHGTDPVPTVDISLSLEPISLRPNSLSGSTDIEAVHKQPCFTIQTVRLLENLGPLTRKAAFDFLLFVSRMDLKSLEKIVDLLILLHHVQNPVQTIHPGAYNLPDSKSGPMTPDKLSGVSSPRSSIGSSTSVRVLRNYRHGSTKELVWDIQPALSGRSDSGFVGLLNGGATCYMNGVLQQLFMQPGLAEALLSVTESDILDEENILFQTQKLFGHLLESQLEYYNPVTFWKSFRPWDTSEAVNPHEQQDAFDFFQALINQLDEELKKLKHEPFFQAIYQGIFLDSKFCDECEHRYDREEVFSAISLAVKAHDLHEALNQFVRGEILDGDNAYYCERCQRKRRTVKRQSVHTLPPVLCLHLKRFDFDWDRQVPVKFSDYFSFPRVLDMSPYMADSVRRLRPEAFLSPVSSASSLLQREAKGTATASSLQDTHSSHDLTKSERRSSTESSKDKACPPSGYTRVPTPVNAQMKSSRSSMRMDMASSSKNPLLQTQEYRYRLVGIVVHSGQANAGHYYSFIKDRGRGEHKCRILVQNMEPPNKVARPVAPSGHTTSTEQKGGLLGQSVRLENTTTSPRHSTTEAPEDDPYDRWYRFNDTSVEPVELTDSLLEHECFGGSYSVPNPNGKPPERRSRYWSAYLLFYERVGLNHDALHHILIANRTSAAAMQAKQPHSPVVTSTHGVSSSLFVLDEGPATGTVSTARVPLRFTLSSSMDNVNSGPSEKHGSVSTHPDDTVGEGFDASEANAMETQATRSGFNMITCPIPHRIAQPIWAENWAFLRDRHIYSRDYFEFIRALCEGILDDVGSLRHQPERAVIGTRLLAHFFFTTFVCLHARSKALITGNLVEGQTMSIQALKELSVQQNSEWLTILLRLASTTPKACRWLMHYLCTSPSLPCPVYLLMAPKPATRQQLANMVLTMLRVFYSFKETNILDAVLTRFVNHLLSLLDNGTVADYATEAGALFAMLRGYAEMCPHANLHLINLKATKRILMYLMEPRPPSAIELELTNEEGSSLGICGYDFPTWEDKLRTWTPVQQREMGNLYYLLALLISQTSFDEYRTIKPANPFSSLPPRGHRHLSQTGLHPHHETVRWLGVPLPDSPAQATCNGLASAPTGGPTQPHIARSLSVTSDEVYLCGLYRLCEILLRAYVENPTTPSLASSFELPIPIGPCVASSPVTTTASSSVFTTTASPIGATAVIDGVVKTTSVQAAASTGTEGTSLRELIRETILHMVYCSWEASFCIIIALLSKISTRPQSELRHLFDLLNELLRLNDPLQNARISAVVDGLYNSPLPPQYSGCSAPKWCPRPVVDPKLWAWKAEELQRSSASYAGHRPCGGSHGPTNMLPLEEEIHPWPSLPRGLLELIITDSCQDARRAYQCMKFIVEVSSETHAVMSYLSRFPDRWEPAVRWLANLLELSDGGGRDLSSQTFSIDQQDSTRGQYRIGEGDAGGLYMVVHSGASGLTDASNESDETNTGFQRTVSAQTTLREATRILFTMPRTTSDSVSVPVPPQTDVSSGVAQQNTHDAVEAESEQLEKAPLFLKLPH
ncbi:unnamed protein product [Dicrocoelium dendriticum]|nr:unnamed protein product [Dicrocoelium dendriticum]